MEEIIAEIKAEYDRCLKLAQHPDQSPELFNVKDISLYYTYRAEGLGYALDRLQV